MLVPPELDLPGPSSAGGDASAGASAGAATVGGATIQLLTGSSAGAAAGATTGGGATIQLLTASEKKLTGRTPSLPEGGLSDLAGETKMGWAPIHLPTFDAALNDKGAKCTLCDSLLVLCHSHVRRVGMVSKISLKCTNEHCTNEIIITSPLSAEAKSFNQTAVFGGRVAGIGRQGLETITACTAKVHYVLTGMFK